MKLKNEKNDDIIHLAINKEDFHNEKQSQQMTLNIDNTNNDNDNNKSFSIASISVGMGYIIISTLLTIFNKELLSKFKFEYISFMIFMQQVSILISLLIGHFLNIIKIQNYKDTINCMMHPAYLLVLVMFCLYVISSLYGLNFVTIPMFTVLRKTGVVVIMALEYLFVDQTQVINNNKIFGVIIIVIGALISGYGELNDHTFGYLICLLCNLATAGYLVAVKRHKSTTGIDSMNLLYQIALIAIPFFLIFSILKGEFFLAINFIRKEKLTFFLIFLCSSSFAGLLNLTTVLNTRLNSPTTQAICASIKDIIVVLTGQFIMPTYLTEQTIIGIIMTFIGAIIYTFSTQFSELFTFFSVLPKQKKTIVSIIIFSMATLVIISRY